MLASSQPAVSVVLPVYNGEAHLEETVRSVLNQSYPGIQFIVVDDGSSDRSAEILADYPQIDVLRQTNSGVPVARNAGAERSTGEFLCFIDQDDLWHVDKVQKQLDAFATDPELAYCTTGQIWYLSPGVERPHWCLPEWLDKPVAGFSPSTLMIRRDAFQEAGRFDVTLPVGSDTDFFFRLKDARAKHVQLNEVLVRKRVHVNNQSLARTALRNDIMITLRRSIERQRGTIGQ